MRVSICLLMALLAGVCFVQTHANILDSIKEKVDDVKESVVGTETNKDEDKKKDGHRTYEGGIVKQVAHTVADAAVDRLAAEAKDQYGNPLTKPVISIAAGKVKSKLHSSINEFGEDSEEEKEKEEREKKEHEQEEKKEHQEQEKREGEEAQGGQEKKGGLGGLLDKVVNRRRKRSVLGGIRNLLTGSAPSPAPAPAPASQSGAKAVPEPVKPKESSKFFSAKSMNKDKTTEVVEPAQVPPAKSRAAETSTTAKPKKYIAPEKVGEEENEEEEEEADEEEVDAGDEEEIEEDEEEGEKAEAKEKEVKKSSEEEEPEEEPVKKQKASKRGE